MNFWLRGREKFFDAIRLQAYRDAEVRLGRPQLRLSPLTGIALRTWRHEWPMWRRVDRDHFDWDVLRTHKRYSRPDRFELALWHRGELCGLAIGRCAGFGVVEVWNMEALGRPDHGLKGSVLATTDVAAATFGFLAGKFLLRLMWPNPNLVRRAEGLGYRFEPEARGLPIRCERSISFG